MALGLILTGDTNNQGRTKINSAIDYIVTGVTQGASSGQFQLDTFGGTPVTGSTRLAGNYIIDGMTVRKDSTNNLKFNIYPGSYLLNGVVYSYAGGSVTLNSNATAYDRIDLIYANNSSTVTKTTGTAASPTLSPSYTETTQLPLSFVIVQSGATAAAGSGGVGQISGGAGNRVASTGETVNFGIFGEATGDRSINLGQFGKVSGKNSISIGGKYNYITGDNITLIGGENVTATTANQVVLGASLAIADAQDASLILGPDNYSQEGRALLIGQDNNCSTLNAAIARVVLGNNNASLSSDLCLILGSSNGATSNGAPQFVFGDSNSIGGDTSGVFAGDNNTINDAYVSIISSTQSEVNGTRSTVIGGQFDVVNHSNAHIIGGMSYTSTTDNTLTVPTLDIREGLRRDYAYNNSSTAVTLTNVSKSVQLFNTSARKYWVTLPNTTGVDSMVVTLKALGDAGTNNVVISGFTGESIDGNPDYTLNTNYQTVTLLWASDISYWLAI